MEGADPVDQAMTGGDDYELLFTTRPRWAGRLRSALGQERCAAHEDRRLHGGHGRRPQARIDGFRYPTRLQALRVTLPI